MAEKNIYIAEYKGRSQAQYNQHIDGICKNLESTFDSLCELMADSRANSGEDCPWMEQAFEFLGDKKRTYQGYIWKYFHAQLRQAKIEILDEQQQVEEMELSQELDIADGESDDFICSLEG